MNFIFQELIAHLRVGVSDCNHIITNSLLKRQFRIRSMVKMHCSQGKIAIMHKSALSRLSFSVCLSIRLSTCNNWRTTEWVCMKFDIFQFYWSLGHSNGHFKRGPARVSECIGVRCLTNKSCEENKT